MYSVCPCFFALMVFGLVNAFWILLPITLSGSQNFGAPKVPERHLVGEEEHTNELEATILRYAHTKHCVFALFLKGLSPQSGSNSDTSRQRPNTVALETEVAWLL